MPLTTQLKASLGLPFHSYLSFCTRLHCRFWTSRRQGRGACSALTLTWFEAVWPLAPAYNCLVPARFMEQGGNSRSQFKKKTGENTSSIYRQIGSMLFLKLYCYLHCFFSWSCCGMKSAKVANKTVVLGKKKSMMQIYFKPMLLAARTLQNTFSL